MLEQLDQAPMDLPGQGALRQAEGLVLTRDPQGGGPAHIGLGVTLVAGERPELQC